MLDVKFSPFLALFLAALVLSGCGRKAGVNPHLDQAYPDRLSGWRLFSISRTELRPAPGVVPYELNTTLFSDYAEKSRTVWMPSGQSARYRGDGTLDFPVGTILTKTFSFRLDDGSHRRVETRLIVHQRSGWVALEYVWNRDQTDANLDVSPVPVRLDTVDELGRRRTVDYVLPNVNQCSACHDGGAEGAVPLGPTVRNLNRGQQLAQWAQMNYLQDAPAGDSLRAPVWDDPGTGSPAARAREYLDVNCGSCHRPGTRAAKTGLLLRWQDPEPDACRIDAIIARMETLDPEKKMPVLGHDVVHTEAVSLIRHWRAGARSCYKR